MVQRLRQRSTSRLSELLAAGCTWPQADDGRDEATDRRGNKDINVLSQECPAKVSFLHVVFDRSSAATRSPSASVRFLSLTSVSDSTTDPHTTARHHFISIHHATTASSQASPETKTDLVATWPELARNTVRFAPWSC